MTYLHESLSSGEKIIMVTRYHWMYLVNALFWAFIFFAGAALILFLAVIYHYYDLPKLPPWMLHKAAGMLSPGDYLQGFRKTHIIIRALAFVMVFMGALYIMAAWLVRLTTEMAVTNRRILLKRGMVARRVEEMRIDYIESADVNQTIMGRIFDYGQVKIYGTGAESIFFPRYTKSPVDFRRALQSAGRSNMAPVPLADQHPATQQY